MSYDLKTDLFSCNFHPCHEVTSADNHYFIRATGWLCVMPTKKWESYAEGVAMKGAIEELNYCPKHAVEAYKALQAINWSRGQSGSSK